VPGVCVGEETPDITEDFEGAAGGEGEGECCEATGGDPGDQEEEEGEGEEGEEDGVGGEGGTVEPVRTAEC
jgi:hypothetical protein